MNVDDLIAAALDSVSAKARAEYQKDLADFANHRKLSPPSMAVAELLSGSFDDADRLVRRYRASMVSTTKRGRGLSPSTVNRRLTIIRKVLKAANRRGLITWQLDVPNVKDERVKETRGPEQDVAAEMLELAAKDESQDGRRAYAILRLGLDLGLRRSSISNLDVSDFNLRSRKIWVSLKGRESKREKSLAPATITALRRWLDHHPVRPTPKTAPLFVNLIPGRHTRLSGPAIYNIVRSLGEPFGIKVWPHGLRHTAVTMAIEGAAANGLTLDEVRDFSDHKDFRMVLRYRDQKKGAQKKFTNSNASALGDPLS